MPDIDAPRFVYGYCHGFLSSERTYKGQHFAKALKEQFGELHLLNLNGGDDVSQITIEKAMKAIDELYHKHNKDSNQPQAKLRLIGSSVGGFVAASYAAKFPDRVDCLVLQAPPVNVGTIIGRRALRHHPDGIEGKTTLVFETHPKKFISVPFSFLEGCRAVPQYPLYTCRAILVQGKHDDIVTLEDFKEFLEKCPEQAKRTEVIVVDDDHDVRKPETLQIVENAIKKLFTLKN